MNNYIKNIFENYKGFDIAYNNDYAVLDNNKIIKEGLSTEEDCYIFIDKMVEK